MAKLELKNPPPLLTVGCALLMWLCAWGLPGYSFQARLAWKLGVAALFWLVGLGIFLVSGRELIKSKTTVNPRHPEKAAVLVVSGLYRFSRNPLYLGDALALAGWAVFLANPWAFLWLPVFVAWLTRFQIYPEERALAARFGSAYVDYTKRVRRWI